VGTFNFLRKKLQRTPILYRIAIGNAFVIALGAIGGTLIVRHLADQAADWWLILLFMAVGTILSVLINFWIIKNALRPLRDLNSLVEQVQSGSSKIDPQFLEPTDPDISQLCTMLDSLVRQLNDRNLELRALSKQSIDALEEERKQIALTLHDDTGQSLSIVIINLERLENQLPVEYSDLHRKLAETRQLAQAALANLRKIVYGLRPTILDDLGLLPAIRWYARANLEEAGILVEINGEGEFDSLPLQVILEVKDDGQGFNPRKMREQALQSHHFGILGMQERAELIGGSIALTSKLDGGTQVQIEVPCRINGYE
jgi:two-component system sensor histidine kinase UhpB